MQVKVRKENSDGIVRVETSGKIKEVMINEDMLHPNNESISICFRGKSSSGIIDLTPSEFELLYESVKSRIHLIKGFKRLSGSGAKIL
jgi:hypothetical protein